MAKRSDSLFRWMWIGCLWAHKYIRLGIFWDWWYANAYGEHGVYSLMYLAKNHGYPWAQPFGKGKDGVRDYLGGRFLPRQRIQTLGLLK